MSKRRKGVLRLRLAPETNRGADALVQLEVPGEKVSVEMGEENVADLPTVGLSLRQILVNITLRINHDGGTRRLIGDEIGGMGQTTEIILFQQHGIFLCCMLVAISPPRHPHRRSASMGSTRRIRLCMVCSLFCSQTTHAGS